MPQNNQGSVCLAPQRGLRPGNRSPEGRFGWPCKSSRAHSPLTTASTLTLALDSALGIVHCDSRKPLGLDSVIPIWSLRMLVVRCYSGTRNSNFHYTIPHLSVPFHRLYSWVTERLDGNTEKVSSTAKSLDTACVCASWQRAERGGGTQSFLGAKNEKTKRFREQFRINFRCLKSPASGNNVSHLFCYPCWHQLGWWPSFESIIPSTFRRKMGVLLRQWYELLTNLHMSTTELLLL